MPRLSEQRETIKSRYNADTIKNNLLKNKSSRAGELSPFLRPLAGTCARIRAVRCLLIKITRSKGNFTYIAGVTIVINLILARSNCIAPIILPSACWERRGAFAGLFVLVLVRSQPRRRRRRVLPGYFRVHVTIQDNKRQLATRQTDTVEQRRRLLPSSFPFSLLHRLSVFYRPRRRGPLSCGWSP